MAHGDDVGGAQAGTQAGAPDSLFVQFTNVIQWHPAFESPYRGALSLDPHAKEAETTDATIFAGWRLADSIALYLNPEIDQGFGLSNTTGVAGFPSGEAYKVGANAPYLRIPRAFVRASADLDGEPSAIDVAPNQVAGVVAPDNLTLTLGKFSVVDIFDANRYAHDPRADFLNWSVIDAAAFDYAADSWGFSYGAALEWTSGRWTLRGGLFDLSTVPNGKTLDPGFGEFELVTELEERHQWLGQDGKFKLLAFVNHASMASYTDALALGERTGTVPSVSAVRREQSRAGAAVNIEQALSADLGIFARLSGNDGRREAYEFTDVNRSFSTGVSLTGARWGRVDDTVGSAIAVNALSHDARDYFAAGGLGILIGDGRLDYGSERISETYYAWHVAKPLTLTLDYQWIDHPAYNRVRGPVSIIGLRAHLAL